MPAKDIMPLYDAMIRLFATSMPNDKVPTQLMAHVLNIPRGTVKKVLATCPLPNGVQLIRGGHRGLEYFLVQPTYISPLGRVQLAMEIKKEVVWAEYGLTLAPHSEEIVVEVEKVLENVKKLKGTGKQKEAMVKNGDPKSYHVMWFAKDIMNGEWYNTVQQAIEKGKGKGKDKPVVSKPVLSMPKLSPSSDQEYAGFRQGRPVTISPMEKYGLINFVADIQGMITSKEQYEMVIKQMQDKINRDYPALIAQKEREKAEAVRESEKLLDKVKLLEKLTQTQTEEIKNLKKHPKFAGFIEKKKRDG